MDKDGLIDLMLIEWSHLEVVVASQVDGRGIIQCRRHSPEVQSWEGENRLRLLLHSLRNG
jgi:hypothetical protein